MKRITLAVSLLLIAALAFVPFALEAQQSSPGAATTQTGSTGLAAQQCLSANGTVSTAQTVTVPAPGGSNSIYFDYISAQIYGTAAIATNSSVPLVTTTNISGSPAWPIASSAAASTLIGVVIPAVGLTGTLGIPIKALAGTSPTIVGPTAVSTYFQFLTACWHVAP